jgi:hypothetical protein
MCYIITYGAGDRNQREHFNREAGAMKSVLILLMLLPLIAISAVHADVCIRHKVHTDGYYYGGVVTEPENREYEVWLGDGKVSFMHEHRMVIYDMNNEKFTFVNFDDSTYVEATLPYEWGDLLAEQDVARVQMYPITGTVGKTENTKEINNHKSCEYEINSWVMYENNKYNERDGKTWMTTDMPFDLSVYKRAYVHYLKLQNLTEELIGEMKEIEGYPIAIETDLFIKGFSVKTTDEVMQVSEIDPPRDVYSAPDGFSKKEKLTIQDLRSDY